MAIDISVQGDGWKITRGSEPAKVYLGHSVTYGFGADGLALYMIIGNGLQQENVKIDFADLTVGGVAPANVGAALTALAAVIPTPLLPRVVTLDEVLTKSNNANTKKIVNLGQPTADQDAATKKYVDDADTAITNKLPETGDNYANDGAAAAGGIAIGAMYHTNGTVKIRLT